MIRALTLALSLAGCSTALDGINEWCREPVGGRPAQGTCVYLRVPFPILDTLESWSGMVR